jgi:hypothetical protein
MQLLLADNPCDSEDCRYVLQRAGMDPRSRESKHGGGVWIAAGANPKEVAVRSGHASVSFTVDRDGHLYPESDLSLRERLDAIWSASGGGS